MGKVSRLARPPMIGHAPGPARAGPVFPEE
jgi:hypothetical protein